MYKILNEKLYKENLVFSTDSINYSRGIGEYGKKLEKFLFSILNCSKVYNLSFFIIFSITRNINNNSNGSIYSKILESERDEITYSELIALSDSHELGDSNAVMKKSTLEELVSIINEYKSPFCGVLDTLRFWEYLYEAVRKEKFPHCPSRLESYFAFKEKNGLDYYQEKLYPEKFGVISCTLDTSKCHIKFEGDMAMLDGIDAKYTYPEAERVIQQYWNQELSKSPVIEVLLRGEVKFLGRL